MGLLGRQIHLTRVSVTDLDVNADTGPKGMRLAAAFRPKAGPAPRPKPAAPGRAWTVRLDALSATGVHYTMHAPGYAVEVTGGSVRQGSLTLALPRVRSSLGEVTLDAVDVTWQGRPLRVTAVHLEGGRYRRTGRPAQGRFAVKSLTAAVGRSTARVGGTVSDLVRGRPWKLDLAVAADVDLASKALQSFVPPAVVRRLDP